MPVAFSASFETLEIFIVTAFFFGLFSIGISLNYLCTITDTSAPVSYNQVAFAPGNVFTEIKGQQIFLLSLFLSDDFQQFSMIQRGSSFLGCLCNSLSVHQRSCVLVF